MIDEQRIDNYRGEQNDLFGSLIVILSDEVAVYEKLVNVSRRKQKSIVDGKIDELRKYIHEEQALIQNALAIAETRNTHINAVCESKGVEDKRARLKSIIEIAPSMFAVELKNLRYRLKSNLNQITRVNKENQYLLNASIEYVKGLVRVFLQADDESATVYSKEGLVSPPKDEMKVLDCQI